MKRRIVLIDSEKCTGCGACAEACHEGAIAMVDGKARLMRDDYCDGLGDCLPACPAGAISFEEREAIPYDEKAVQEAKAAKAGAMAAAGGAGTATVGGADTTGCPGTRAKQFTRTESTGVGTTPQAAPTPAAAQSQSQLAQWPVQIKLLPIKAPFFQGANLLIAADCTAYAYARFHEDFIKGKVTLVGCPKLDAVDYSEKLTEIIAQNDITGVTVVRMEVPCCGGLEMAAKKALQASGKFLPWQVVTIATDGHILDD